MNLSQKDMAYIRKGLKESPEKDHEQIMRFFTSCCKHCRMADLSCSASMMCMCHSEQIDEIKEALAA
jgi:hypothetical protein